MTIFATYPTNENHRMKTSKWAQELLRLPLSISISALSKDQMESLLNYFISLGAVRFGCKPIREEEGILYSVIQDFKDELKKPFNYDKGTYFHLDFNEDSSLRFGVNNSIREDGRAMYDYDSLVELITNLKCELPLSIEKSSDKRTRAQVLAKKITNFLLRNAEVKSNYNPDYDEAMKYTSLDASTLYMASKLLQDTGEIPVTFSIDSSWEKGGYAPYSDIVGQELHDKIIEDCNNFKSEL